MNTFKRLLPTTGKVIVLLHALTLFTGCASKPTYDPSARESTGRIVAKINAGTRTQLRGDTPITSGLAMYGAVGMALAKSMEKTSEVPLYDYRIKTADSREISIVTTYAFNEVGECVKVFESTQPTYPRFIADSGCDR